MFEIEKDYNDTYSKHATICSRIVSKFFRITVCMSAYQISFAGFIGVAVSFSDVTWLFSCATFLDLQVCAILAVFVPFYRNVLTIRRYRQNQNFKLRFYNYKLKRFKIYNILFGGLMQVMYRFEQPSFLIDPQHSVLFSRTQL